MTSALCERAIKTNKQKKFRPQCHNEFGGPYGKKQKKILASFWWFRGKLGMKIENDYTSINPNSMEKSEPFPQFVKPIQNMQISTLINFINKDFQKQNGRINTNTIFKKVGTPCQGIVIICEGSPTRHLWRQWRHAAQQPLKTNQLCKFSHAQSNTPRRFLESAAKTFFQEVRS